MSLGLFAIEPPGGPAAIVPVLLGSNFTNSSNTVAITAGAIIAGDLVVVGICINAGVATVSSVSDGTNTYVKAVSATTTNGSGEIWYKENAAAVASPTITVTISTSSLAITAVAARYPDGGLTSTLDKTASNNSVSSNGLSCTTATLAQVQEIVFASANTGVTGGTITTSAGFTTLGVNNSGTCRVMLDYQLVTATTAITYSPTWSTASKAVILQATFKRP